LKVNDAFIWAFFNLKRTMRRSYSRKYSSLSLALLLLPLLGNTDIPVKEARPLGIIAPSTDECAPIQENYRRIDAESIQGLTFFKGVLNGRPIVLVRCGVGKVNAASATTLLIERYRPSGILMIGIAGALSADVHPGDVVIAKACVQHDQGLLGDDGWRAKALESPIDATIEPSEYPADRALLASAEQACVAPNTKIVTGTVATGDVFVSSSRGRAIIRTQFKADAVDMESGAAAQVCWQQSVPFLAIRGITDMANNNAADDVRANFRRAANSAASIVIGMTREK
jgi:adenosylhomocysteine nucleosidase